MSFYRLSNKFMLLSIATLIVFVTVATRPLQAQEPINPNERISGDLLQLIASAASADNLSELTPASENFLIDEAIQKVAIMITAQDVERLLPVLESRGFETIGSDPEAHLVEGYMPFNEILNLPELAPIGLMGVLPVYRPLTSGGSVTSQADVVHEADRVRATLPAGYDGTGIEIGILSDSYDDLGTALADVTSGDLPASVIIVQDLGTSGSDEGRAMMQLAYDIAPGATYAFATAFTGQTGFANNIRNLAGSGPGATQADADVIVDDVIYFSEPFFQDGIIAQAVDDVVNNDNVTYFSSAGNRDTRAYESTDFNATADNITGVGAVTAHDFDSTGGTDTRQRITLANGQRFRPSLQWDDPFYTVSGVDTNLDIYLLTTAGTVVASATNNNILSQTPNEILDYTNSTGSSQSLDVVIVLVSGPAPSRVKYINFGSDITINEYDTNSPTLNAHAAAEGAQAVAAAFYGDHLDHEGFTSNGPSTILFDKNGTPLGSPVTRQTPDITAVDGTNTTFFGALDWEGDGFLNFFGTSAAAPHAAAITALIRQANPSATPTEIYTLLSDTATDITAGSASVGFDNVTGAGLINAYDAIYSITPQTLNPSFNDGFESGVLSDAWETHTQESSRILVTTSNGPNSGTYHVTMDTFGDYGAISLNELILHLNLEGGSNVQLSFDQREYGAEFDDVMSAVFTGSENSDGVAMSVDGGITWYRLFSLTGATSTSTYQTQSINLSTVASNNALILGSDVRIKFQQYDTSPIATTGMAFDNIQITSDTPTGSPEISVSESGINLVDGVSTVDFGTTEVGTSISKTFTISNTGTTTLTLSSLGITTGFDIASNFGTTDVGPNGSTTFVISLTAAFADNYVGTVSFNNNDSDENPFGFEVTGDVTAVPEPEIQVTVDGGDLADGGSLDFGTTSIGSPISKTLTISNTGTAALSLSSLSLPSGYSVVTPFNSPVLIGTDTTLVIQLDAGSVNSFSGSVSFTTNDSDENPFNFSVSGDVLAIPVPEITVTAAGENIADGGSFNFGSTLIGNPISQTFTISNTGTSTLTLSNLTVPAGFAIESGFGLIDVPTDTATTFVISLTATAVDSYSGTLSFDNNDPDEDPFQFTVSGDVLAEPEPEISVTADGSNIVDGGSYDFGTTTIGTPISQTFIISNSGTTSLTLANLTIPAGFTVTQSFSATVGAGLTTTLGLQLEATAVNSYSGEVSFNTNDSDENPFNFIISGDVLGIPEIEVTVDGNPVADGGNVDFGTTLVGEPITKTFTISNTGSATLTLANLTVPAGFAVAADFGVTDVPTDTSTTFVISLTATAAGTYSGTLSFDNNDPDENPFDIVVEGTVIAPEINVVINSTNIANGSGFVDFGSTIVGNPISKEVTIHNNGTAALVVSDFTVPSGFTLTAPISATIPVSSETAITLTLEAAVAGIYSGTVSFTTNDAAENPFAFTVEGTVTDTPEAEIQVLDGATNIVSGVGIVDLGTTPFATPATQVLTVRNAGTAALSLGSLTVPDGYTAVFSDTLIAPSDSTLLTVTLTADAAGTFSGTLSFVTNDTNENPFSFEVTGVVDNPPDPEITLFNGSQLLIDGVSEVDFGTVLLGEVVTRTFTVENNGLGDLLLSDLAVTGSGFIIASDFATTTVAAGDATTFTIELDTAVVGEFTAIVSFANNDANENPFSFTVVGIVFEEEAPAGVYLPVIIGN